MIQSHYLQDILFTAASNTCIDTVCIVQYIVLGNRTTPKTRIYSNDVGPIFSFKFSLPGQPKAPQFPFTNRVGFVLL